MVFLCISFTLYIEYPGHLIFSWRTSENATRSLRAKEDLGKVFLTNLNDDDPSSWFLWQEHFKHHILPACHKRSSSALKNLQMALPRFPSFCRYSQRMHCLWKSSVNRQRLFLQIPLQTYGKISIFAWLDFSLLLSSQKWKHLNSNSFLVYPLANSSHKPTKVRVQLVKSLSLVLLVHLPFRSPSINSPFLHKSFNLFRHSRYGSLLNRCCFYMIVSYVESILCGVFIVIILQNSRSYTALKTKNKYVTQHNAMDMESFTTRYSVSKLQLTTKALFSRAFRSLVPPKRELESTWSG